MVGILPIICAILANAISVLRQHNQFLEWLVYWCFFIFGSTCAGFWYYVEILQFSCIFTHRKWLKDSSRGIVWYFHVLVLAKYWWWFIVLWDCSQSVNWSIQPTAPSIGLSMCVCVEGVREKLTYTNLHNFGDIVIPLPLIL